MNPIKLPEGMNTNQPTHVMYVKLSSYYAAYLTTRYGNPVSFPMMSSMSMCIERYLVHNPSLKEITPFSYSEAGYAQRTQNNSLQIKAHDSFDSQTRSAYVAIEIPREVMRPKGLQRTSPCWQLSYAGTKEFRRQVKRDFWIYFQQFYADCKYRAARDGSKVTLEDTMSDFLTIYGISMDHLDNMLRSWWRVCEKIREDIEGKRDLMEEKTRQSFFFTV